MSGMLWGILGLCILVGVQGHGRLDEPPGRSTCWRYNIDGCETNYNDNQLFCGGFDHQWVQNRGNCGVCGDAYDDPEPHENEAGGKYAKGVIVRSYEAGQVIWSQVTITAEHKGFFEFRLCVNNDVTKTVTQECLDQHILGFADRPGTKYYGRPGQTSIDSIGLYEVPLKLPDGVTCSQCVLQWKYHTGNSWGCSLPQRDCGLGRGPQEEFYGCADIQIA